MLKALKDELIKAMPKERTEKDYDLCEDLWPYHSDGFNEATRLAKQAVVQVMDEQAEVGDDIGFFLYAFLNGYSQLSSMGKDLWTDKQYQSDSKDKAVAIAKALKSKYIILKRD